MIYARKLVFLGVISTLFSLQAGVTNYAPVIPRDMVIIEKPCLDKCFTEDCPLAVESPTTPEACRFLSYYDPETCFKICVDLRHRPEAFYNKSTELLSSTPLDQGIYAQSAWDLFSNIDYKDLLHSKLGVRTKARWGTDELIKSTESEVKVAGISVGRHRHSLGRKFFWLREGWFQVDLTHALCLPTDNKHYLKVGAFPFELGRGISLGAAFAVTPGIIGFYTSEAIDQFPWGINLHGEIEPCALTYDLYYELALNLTDRFSRNAQNVFTHTIAPNDKRTCPQRGFGKSTWISAARLKWAPQLSDCWSAQVEPYALYAIDAEEKIDIRPDANLKIGTLGIAFSTKRRNFEFGIEGAFNMGRQEVLAIDRNAQEVVNRDGALVPQYTKVYVGDPTASGSQKALVTDTNKAIVDSIADFKAPSQNGLEITDTGLFNATDRFRRSHKNKLRGRMMISDFGWSFCEKDYKVVGTFGYASGDKEHPNTRFENGVGVCNDAVDVNSFVGLQEVYAGKLVQSIFINNIPRSFSITTGGTDLGRTGFASRISGYTNLMLAGGGVHWTPQCSKRKLEVKPNLILFWQPAPDRKFNFVTGQEEEEDSSRMLGTEFNTFIKARFLDDTLKFFFVGSVFFPGQHYRDIKGKPLDNTQLKILSGLTTRTESEVEDQALLGNTTAIALNFGFEYTF